MEGTARAKTALASALALLASLALASPAGAFTKAAAAFTIHSLAVPTNFSTADNSNSLCSAETGSPQSEFTGCDSYQVTVTNAGAAATDGSPVTLSDALPAGLVVQRVAFFWSGLQRFLKQPNTTDLGGALCTTSPVRCTLPFPMAPDDTLEMVVYVTVPAGSETLTNSATVSGGGAASVSTEAEPPSALPNSLNGPTPSFGPAFFSAYISGPDGLPETQAGAHPYELTTRIDLKTAFKAQSDAVFRAGSVQDPKDIAVDLPLGFLGTALATPTCTFAELSSRVEEGFGGCPSDTIVGRIVTEPTSSDSVEGPIYNMVPEHGVAAEFAFVDLLAGSHVLYSSVVPTPSGYVLRTTARDIPQNAPTDILVTLYGDPAARDQSTNTPVALFTNPSACGQPSSAAVHMDSWQSPGRVGADGQPDLSDPNWVSASSPSPPMSGCNRLRFSASMSMQSETAADSPSGLDVRITVPQSEQPGTLATPPLRDAVVRLPAGFSVDPSAAAGLAACSPAQIALASAAPANCPDASKIGTVELTTPLEAGVLHGSIYLATEYENPFTSLLAGYIVVEDPTTGVVVKIPGELQLDEGTGQITGVFKDSPQLPFSELTLHFKGGPRGALATPEVCGGFTATAVFTPWSAPESGPDASLLSPLPVSSGCVAGFAPSFSAGVTIPQAGSYSPFVLSFSRSDADQEFSRLSVTLPPGLLANIAGVQLCGEAEIAAAGAVGRSGAQELAHPSCPEGSQVGTVQAGAGPGPTPFFTAGKAYLTGPYNGGPYGLAVIVPALAGPFDLGNVVVRASLRIDPTDGHVTAVSDPLPSIVKGIPLRLRRIDVLLQRPDGAPFTVNPTSCEPMAIAAGLTSAAGQSARASSRFQVGGCQGLPFAPSFSASTQGRTSKAAGASLTVTVAQRAGEANIRRVDLQLPLALPSRLTTLQKACTEAQFDANPAGCPEASNVGSATAVTPILSTPLSGPAYLVSHGSAAFPDLEFVLQGAGVTIILDGKTQIKNGVTYSHFETVPDAPISSFVSTLPEGGHSALAANTNLCAVKRTITVRRRVTRRVHGKLRRVLRTTRRAVPATLQMPTTITAQSGKVVTQDTRIAVRGCPAPGGRSTVKARGRARHRHRHP